MKFASALYTGSVMHQRLRPARHRLRYRMFSLLVDLDELPSLTRRLRLFSLNRFNLFSLHERDYGDGASGGGTSEGEGGGLRGYVDRQLRAAGLPAGGAIRLLTMPRILGYAFNPLSVYFCDGADGALRALLYEVNNTFGERHSYLIEVDAAQRDSGRIVQGCAKEFRVSPFLANDLRYVFRVEPPHPERAALSLGVVAHDGVGALVNARFDAQRRRLDDAALARVFFSHPLLTFKVIAAIHWEALRLLVKGVRLQPTPAAPAGPLTIVKTSEP
ncbi:MAG: DUF1365 family protein [Pseudomonadota bacterium]|nr:DUF1365 family protein [Pseudomonadota bacterium]